MKRFLRSAGFYFLLAILLLASAFYFDGAVQQWMTHHQTHSGIVVMQFASRWGDWPPHIAVGLIGVAISWSLGSRAWMTIFVAMILACAVAGIINPIIKGTAGRARPSVKVDAGWNGPSSGQKYHSFPSGHTVATSAFFGALILARRRIGLALLPIPVLIAFSRLYLNAHFLSDVVFGALLGICCALIAWRLIRRWEESRIKETVR
ncbi:MAG: phosphatase PAP2 family protein [Chthoniobacterales bacterium]